MIEDKYIELINKEIDGVNSQKESAKLKEYLAKNPEAQALFNDLLTISNMLNKVNEIEPSPNLKKNIINAIQSNKYAIKEKRNLWKSLISSVQFKVRVKYAYAFSAGLIVGLLIYSLVIDKIHKETSLDISSLYGTITLNRTSRSFETADHLEFNLDEVNGTVNIKYSKDIVLAELTLKTHEQIEIVFEFDESDISFSSFARLRSNNVGNNLNIGENNLKLTNIGDNKYLIVFNDKTEYVTPMNFKIFSFGALLYKKTISTGRKSY